ncbi:MAG TPA: HAD-IIA family hydrolase [Candidatus Brocadiia bacterium]|nr:HAD-IIA family hydrolase [Candidatus Brocadiia bacterium]
MTEKARKYKSYLMDMDGVLVKGKTVIPGAQDFLGRLKARGLKFLILTNNPMYTQADLSHRLKITGLDIPPENIFTSAMATAMFLNQQKKGGTAFVIGESGLTSAMHGIGYILTDHDPDYVVLGETFDYNIRAVTKAVQLVARGSKFVATNPDPSGPTESGLVPACGAMAALIEKTTGRAPFFVGKPNPLMMRSALNYIGAHSEETVMIGDRMDTDVIAGLQAGMDTILVLSGVTARADVSAYPFRPTMIVKHIGKVQV